MRDDVMLFAMGTCTTPPLTHALCCAGHNQQESAWTFSGAGEVTVNLFTLYSMQRLHGIEPIEHPWLVKQKPKALAYVQDEAATPKEKWGRWKADPGLALWMYAQLQHE